MTTSPPPPHPSGFPSLSPPARSGARDVGAIAVSVALSAVLLAVPALWNGFPFLFFDSIDYIRTAAGGPTVIFRTYPYSVVLMAGQGAQSLWGPVVLQCLAVAWVLFETLCAFGPARLRPERLLPAVAAVLAVVTGLPWYAGQIMPDAFTGVVPLAIAVLAFAGDRLPWPRRLALAGLVVVGAATHSTHLLTATVLVLGLVLLRALPAARWLGPRPALPAAAVAAAYLVVLATHWALAGRPFLNDAGPVFLFARFLESGLAQRTLTDLCPDPRLPQMCSHIEKLPDNTNFFLWGTSSPFGSMGSFTGLKPEAAIVVEESLRRYPLEHLAAAVRSGLTQITVLGSGEGLREPQVWLFRDPGLPSYPTGMAARQQQDPGLAWLFDGLNPVHGSAAWVGYAGVIGLGWLGWRRRERLVFALPLVVGGALLVNAGLCGGLAAIADRYQNRIVWTAVLVFLVVGAAAARRHDKNALP